MDIGTVKRIVVINGKGGCGKTTVVTNLASSYAARGVGVALFDYDPQGSALQWLALRPDYLPGVRGVAAFDHGAANATRSWLLRTPPGVQRIIIDTPAGLKGQALTDQLRNADVVIMPVLPSTIDIAASANFIKELLLVARVRSFPCRLALVANRVRQNTRALESLKRFLKSLNIPVIGHIRDTQNYVLAAERGVGVVEIRGRRLLADQQVWNRMVDWIEQPQPGAAVDHDTGPSRAECAGSAQLSSQYTHSG